MKPAESVAPGRTPIESLEQDIHNLCVGINAATYELLTLIREFDERAGFLKWGLQDSAHWLAWRCDLSVATAREKVRTAHALKELPLISKSFSTGELSYTKVRALTRVANSSNEEDLLGFALRHTAAQVADCCRELRMGDAASTPVAERAFANRFLSLRRVADRAIMVLNVELPLEAGDLIEKALDKARDDAALEHPDIMDTTWSKRQADAFVTLLKEYLAGDSGDGRGSDHFLVNIHVDHSALAGKPGKAALPLETVKRICCDSQAVVITEDNDGIPLDVGRKSRVVPTALGRAVRARDNGCCRFPGCRNHRFLECHHVEHWSNGGETSLENLLLLCTKHHTMVHDGGFSIRKDFNDEWAFFRPDNVAVPAIGYQTQDMVDCELDRTAYLDPPAGGLLSVAERFALEPPPPKYAH